MTAERASSEATDEGGDGVCGARGGLVTRKATSKLGSGARVGAPNMSYSLCGGASEYTDDSRSSSTGAAHGGTWSGRRSLASVSRHLQPLLCFVLFVFFYFPCVDLVFVLLTGTLLLTNHGFYMVFLVFFFRLNRFFFEFYRVLLVCLFVRSRFSYLQERYC